MKQTLPCACYRPLVEVLLPVGAVVVVVVGGAEGDDTGAAQVLLWWILMMMRCGVVSAA